MNTGLAKIAAALVLAVCSSLDAHAASPAATPVSGGKQPPASAAVANDTAKGAVIGISVLERFRSYSGPRTPAALSALFSRPLPANIRQQPEIALSDGVTTVTIEAEVAAPNGTAPNVASTGSRLISVKRNDAGKWVIGALPAKGSWKASLIMLTDSATLEVPLVVAPLLPAETNLSEQGFIAFLGSKTPNSQPLKDLNGDGKRDYLDDYIFTANYLVRQRSAAPDPDNSPSSESQDPGTIRKSDVPGQNPEQSSEIHDPGAGLNSDPQVPGSGQSSNPQGSYSGQASTPQAPLGGAGAGAGTVPGTVPAQGTGTGTFTAPLPAPEIKLDTTPDRHNLTNRNERARKIKELLNPPIPVQ